MKMWAWMIAAAAVLTGSGLAMAQGTAPAASAGNWVLERSPARCVISRQYDSTKGPVTLGIKAPPLGDAMQVVVLRPGDRNEVRQARARISIDQSDAAATALTYPAKSGSRITHLVNLGGEQAAALRRAREIELWVKVSMGGSLKRRFALEPIANAWTQLDACLLRLRQTWNLDEQNSIVATWPEPVVGLQHLFSERDYPSAAMVGNQTGRSHIILLVDERGTVRDCTLAETSGAAVLDAATCGIILTRARFKPAIDVQGKAVKAAYETRIRWRLV